MLAPEGVATSIVPAAEPEKAIVIAPLVTLVPAILAVRIVSVVAIA